jgi:hypothetical protein
MTLPPDKLPLPQHKSGVEAWTVDGDGGEIVILNPSQAPQRWPGVSVDSGRFDKLEPCVKLYQQAIAFLVSAKVLSEYAGTRAAAGGEVTWPQGSVCYSNLNTAIELFLKACIWAHSGNQPKKTHNLAKLQTEYTTLMPQTEFQFNIPPAWLSPKMFNNSIESAPDQRYKYHIGNNAEASELTHVFRPDIVFNRVNELERVWQNVWEKLSSSKTPSV